MYIKVFMNYLILNVAPGFLFKPGAQWPKAGMPGFMKLHLSMIGMCVCLCVCVHPLSY